MSSFPDRFTFVNPALAIVRTPRVASPATPLAVVMALMQAAEVNGRQATLSQDYPLAPTLNYLYLDALTSCAVVVDNERVVGIFTLRDVAQLCYRHPQWFGRDQSRDEPPLTLGEVMTQPVITLPESALTDIAFAIDLLQQHHIHHLPILDDQQRLVGLVTQATLQHSLLVHQLCWSGHQRAIIANIEQRYANLIDAAPVGIFHTDQDGRCTYANERWFAMTGLKAAEAIHQPWHQSIHPGDLPLVLMTLDQAARQRHPFCCEFRLQHQGGEVRWVYGQMVAERDARGTVVSYVGTLTDISDRKQFEVALQQSDAKSRNILSLLPDLLFRIDARGQYRDIVTYRDNISLVAEGINPVGRTMAEVLPPRLAHLQMGYLQTALATGELGIYEQEVVLENQSRWEEVRVIKSGNDEALFMVRDISDRKHAEQALQALIEGTAAVTGQDFFPSLVRHIAAALQVDYALVTELRGHHELHPLAFWAQNELRPAHAYNCSGTPCEQVMQKGIYYCHAQALQYFLADAELSSEMQVDCYLGVTLQNAQGNPIGTLCVFHRYPLPGPQQAQNLLRVFAARAAAELERQKATASLQHLNQELETKVLERTQALQQTNVALARATRLKDEFLANMSHELRTPLNAVLGLAEALQEGVFGDLNQAQLKTLNTIETSGQHLLELINDILDVAKIESGKMDLQWALTNMADLCQSSCMFVARQAQKNHIQLEIDLPPELPPLMVDERRMRQVLINLLSNAVKFTPPGGRVTLAIRYLPDSSPQVLPSAVLEISVTDTGIGLAPDKLPQLFQPFEQVDSALNRQYQGTGLGLTLVKRIVELHGGQVVVTSEPGQGSCFTINLPCPAMEPSSNANPYAPGKQTSRQETNPALLTSVLILIAEANEASMITMSGYLRARGYHILQARSGQGALALAASEGPDLILIDLPMPDMDSLEAVQKIRQTPALKAVPVVAISDPVRFTDRDRCLAAGANQYLAKPLKLKQLAIILQQQLSGCSPPGRK